MKKSSALVLTLVLTLALTACGKKDAAGPASGEGPNPFKIGYPSAPIHNPTIDAMEANRRAVAEAAGGELMLEVFDFTPEGTVNAIEKLIANGCDGLMVTPFADAILPKITQMCDQAGVYWVISMRDISDPEIKKMVESSKYFIGYVKESEEAAGYQLMKELGSQGTKEVALLSTPKSDTTGQLREKGMIKAADELGIKIVAEMRNVSQASDAAKAVQSFIASYPQLDGIIRVASTAPGDTVAAAKTIAESGKKIKFATIDTEPGLEEYMDQGIVSVVSGGTLVLDSAIAASLLVNSVIGTPIDENNKVVINIDNIFFKSSDDLTKYSTFVEGDLPIYTAEETKKMLLKYYNPDLTAADTQTVVNQFSVADVYDRHKDLVK